MNRKGILLAGGSGSRLLPLTAGVSKQLLPVYDKPLIYYPLTTLMLAGVREILVVVNPHNSQAFERLLGDGGQWGISITYATQEFPAGIAEGLIIGEKFLQGNSCIMILGDTIFHGAGLEETLSDMAAQSGAATTRMWIDDPRRFGVVEIDTNMSAISIEEKPMHPKSNYAVPGLYFLDESAPSRAKALNPSERGELEITDLLQSYLEQGMLHTTLLPLGTTWLDIGSIGGLFRAAELVKAIEDSEGRLVGSPDVEAWRKGWISKFDLLSLAEGLETRYGRMIATTVHQGMGI